MTTLRSPLALLVLVISVMQSRAADTMTQTIPLRAGWNAVWLEVSPPDKDPVQVFNGLPIQSVWTYGQQVTSADFIVSPEEPAWNRNAWLSFAPTNRPEAINNNLFRIDGNRAYLIKASAPANLLITGRPSLNLPEWTENAHNLRGFPVDPGALPTFLDFFRPSRAHFDAESGQLQEIHSLNAAGKWVRVAPGDSMQSGVAYWVYSKGASDYVAPISARLTASDGLDFGRELETTPVSIQNHGTIATTVFVSEQQRSQASTALGYGTFSILNGQEWLDMPGILPRTLDVGGTDELRLLLRRKNMTGSQYSSIIQVIDNAGTRLLIPLSGERYTAADEGRSRAGLWVGTISVNAVSEVHSGNLVVQSTSSNFKLNNDGSSTPGGASQVLSVERVNVSPLPTPTGSDFRMRVILHVDTNGVIRMLREVIQMWKDGTTVPGPGGLQVVDTPGRYVLVTDESKIASYKGAALRDGAQVGRRISSVGFDFPISSSAQNYLELTGSFAVGQSLKTDIVLDPRHPTNPYFHKYHPDHDNKAADFRAFKKEAFTINRSLQFDIAPSDPEFGGENRDYGYKTIAGVYNETISGLHRNPIYAKGSFRLQRVSEIGSLNE